MQFYFDRKGEPIDLQRWADLKEDPVYSIVARSIRNGWTISTVWLGLNHAFMDGPPVIFETMIFGPDGKYLDYQERYCTEEAAWAGHDQAVAWLIEKLGI